MFRSFFISLSKAAWAKNIITGWSFAWSMASRFIAGEKLEDAITVIKTLNSKGINTTLDHLGENTTTPEEARRATQAILEILDAIDRAGVCSNVSIKLSQIGLLLDKALCVENLAAVLEHAAVLNNFVRIDMEDSTLTQATLDVVHQIHLKGFNNVGTVIQSYLHRSEKDICKLVEEGVRVRLCKGAYKEPTEIAYPKKKDVDVNYDHLAMVLIEGLLSNGSPKLDKNGKVPPLLAIATHDTHRISFAKSYAQKVNLPNDAMEFQLLYGIRRDLQEQLVAEGYPVRIYVPYGTQWYPYFMRRLGERPANVWFIVSNFFRQ